MKASGVSIIRDLIIVGVFLAMLAITFLPEKEVASPMQAAGSTYGRILLDSPEIYTRERMVNDRFRQEAWLLEQLDKLTAEKPGVQGIVAGRTSSQRAASLALGAGAESPQAPTPNASESSEPIQPGAAQPQITPIESFRGHQSVREEVRNALIENQLDDRHDLGGNTLYRLKFDATVIPGNDTSAWAQIKVRFKHKESSAAEQERDLEELYQRWKNDLREQVNATFSEEVRKTATEANVNARLYKTILGKYGYNVGFSGTREWWDGVIELDGPQCRDLLLKALTDDNAQEYSETEESGKQELLEMQGYSPERFDCLMRVAPRLLGCEEGSCRQRLIREDVMGKVVDVYGTTLGQKEGLNRELRKSGGGRSSTQGVFSLPPLSTVQPDSGQQFVSFLPAPDLNSILVEEYAAKIYVVPTELTAGERDRYNAQNLNRYYAIPTQLNDNERNLFLDNNDDYRTDEGIIMAWEPELGCPDLIPVVLNEREYRICASTLDSIQPQIYETDSAGELTSLDVEISNDYDGLPFFVTRTDSQEILAEWTNAVNCPKTAPIKVAQREYRICESWIGELRDLELAADSGADVLSIDAKIETEFDGLPYVVVKLGYSKFRQKLEKSEREKFLFSYAVTPRESSQHLASSSSLAIAEQLRASAVGGVNGASIAADAGRSNLFSEYAQILERRPVIVGIASHRSEGSLESGDSKSAELGWLIGPKLVVGADGLTTYRHLPSQNSLSALVSAPSWWRRADIEIETGWLDQQGELVGEPVSFSYPIALPGDQEEITSALLLGGKRPAPSVESVEPMRVRVGEEARLLIEGQNLWRSTVVTIGAQRSKKIFVLPNMKGIIAEFEPIEIQGTRPIIAGSPTAVRVWTSEGVAIWKDGITVLAADDN